MNSSNMNKTPNMTSSSTSASSTSSNDGVASSSTATSSSSGLNTVDEFNKEFLSKLTRCRDELVEHAKSVEAFKTSSQQSVVEPMKNLNSIFPQVYQAIRRRETALRELLKQQEKLDKLQDRERTGPNLVRINELQLTVSQVSNIYFYFLDFYIKKCYGYLIKLDLMIELIYELNRVELWVSDNS